jgi:2-C-methyl-D-erythritol 4-phosphate cytidylyltransferase
MEGDVPKQFMELDSRPILVSTLEVFESWQGVDEIIVVVPANEQDRVAEWTEKYRKVTQIVSGGPRRQDSVYNGLKAVGDEIDIVIVHDGVRPLVTPQILQNCAEVASRTGAAIAAVPIKDTVKEAGDKKTALRTLDRGRLWSVQTPQAFSREILMQAMEKAAQDSFTGTDEASLVERLNIPVSIVEGSYENIKITTPEDILFAKLILSARGNG